MISNKTYGLKISLLVLSFFILFGSSADASKKKLLQATEANQTPHYLICEASGNTDMHTETHVSPVVVAVPSAKVKDEASIQTQSNSTEVVQPATGAKTVLLTAPTLSVAPLVSKDETLSAEPKTAPIEEKDDRAIVAPDLKAESSSSSSTASVAVEASPNIYREGPLTIERIRGTKDHIEQISSLIDATQATLDMQCWSLGFIPKPIFSALQRADRRGVEMKLNVGKGGIENKEAEKSLEEFGVKIFDGHKSHTKLLCADDFDAIIGSYNFLSTYTKEDKASSEIAESSFKISGDSDFVESLNRRIFSDLMRYKNNEKPLPNPFAYDFPDDSKFTLLTNLYHHDDFFENAIRAARKKIIIRSPFTNYYNALDRFKVMGDAISKGVSVVIYVQQKWEKNLNWALNKYTSLKNRVTVKLTAAHRKTFVVDPESDDCTLCEGSFNWFCASTELNKYASQETSIVLRGPAAKQLLCEDDL